MPHFWKKPKFYLSIFWDTRKYSCLTQWKANYPGVWRTEDKFKDITWDKEKIIKTDWHGSGQGCMRANCILFTTKTKEKNSNKDCAKKNLLYEMRCLSCEENKRKIIEDTIQDERKRNWERLVSPVMWERLRGVQMKGALNTWTSWPLCTARCMLQHIVTHEGKDFSEVKWGMVVIKYV